LSCCTRADDAHVIVGGQTSGDHFWTIVNADSRRGDEFSIGKYFWFVADKEDGAVENVHLVDDGPSLERLERERNGVDIEQGLTWDMRNYFRTRDLGRSPGQSRV
jgi:hypothetical protein